nr:immunoglobulin light chain junction region [Macaca mulatta]MPN92440.1 immunoglobulin light chain junction region [Macaca mulatta]MPN95477.1 immunoglobulin light chain junction region [Macaca mulatta]MPN95956.1 immunoglobulin light chain junction region [Macaca mulatta]MPN98640.1 immunoglobulin light chain junction region [Macaca mulatta]
CQQHSNWPQLTV